MESDQQIEQNQAQVDTLQSYLKQTNTRFVYNLTPDSRELIDKAGISNAVHFTPFDEDVSAERIQNIQGLTCSRCSACISCYCSILKDKKCWICNICSEANPLNKQMPDICLSAQTYEIQLFKSPNLNQQGKCNEQIFLFLVDLCVEEKQLNSIKQSLRQFIENKRKSKCIQFCNIKVGLITFSKFIYLYQLNSEINSVISFSGKRPYQNYEIVDLLGLPRTHLQNNNILPNYQLLSKKYLANISNQAICHRILKKIDKLKAEGQVTTQQGKRSRALRSSGQAINISLHLAENIPFQTRIVSFFGGPCTHGVGKVIGHDFNEKSRSINEIDNDPDELTHYDSARKFYLSLKDKVLGKGIILDFFLFSLEEVGIAEMYEVIRISGGHLVLGQQFSDVARKKFECSFRKAYIQLNKQDTQNQGTYGLSDLSGTSAILNVLCSQDISICGALGQCHPLKDFGISSNKSKYRNFDSQNVQGFGKTNAWYLGSLDLYRTITFLYEKNRNCQQAYQSYSFQFKTFYTDCYGRKIARITNVTRLWDNNIESIAKFFDQQSAALLLARLYIYKQMYDIKKNNKHWIDKSLVSWARTFAKYQKGDIASFSLPPTMKYLPQFIYNFRRGNIFRRQGIALDELYYKMHYLNRQNIDKCIRMIQPALLSYSIQKLEPVAVKLNEQEMKQNVILLLDTYFHIVLWYGQNVCYWKQEKYHQKQEYQHVKALLAAPDEDIELLMDNRFPYPYFAITNPHHPTARFLKSKIYPKDSSQNQNMLTDDSSLQKFTRVLIQLVVKSKK